MDQNKEQNHEDITPKVNDKNEGELQSPSRRDFLKKSGLFAMAMAVGPHIPLINKLIPGSETAPAAAVSPLPYKYVVSSDSRYMYFLDENFQNALPPIHKNAVNSGNNAPLDTLIIDPFKPEYFWAGTEFNSSGDPNNPTNIYSFKVSGGVVSDVQSYDISHLTPTLGELEGMCIDTQNRKILLADNPRAIYVCDENFNLITYIGLDQFGYSSPQGICYVPWLDGYLITDNNVDKLLVVNENEDILWEIHVDRLDPVPINMQGVDVDYATGEILVTYYQPSDAVVVMNWGGIQKTIYPNSLWELTNNAYANPTSISIVQDPFRYSRLG